jgi:hypothetical protein
MRVSIYAQWFDAVCHLLATDDAGTRNMVPEVQALVALYSLDISTHQTIESLLITVAELGHVRMIKTGMLALDSAMQQQVKWEVAKTSLIHGHLSIAQWLHASFHLSAADVRSNNTIVLRQACINGHLAVLQHLHTEFQLTREDARTYNNDALIWACAYGHYNVVHYLHTAFQLTSEDARTDNNRALRFVCSRGHLAVLQYLHTAFQLTIEDMQANNNEALRVASSNGHCKLVEYLENCILANEGK